MKRRLLALALGLLFALNSGSVAYAKKPVVQPEPPPVTGPVAFAALPNLSFPVIATDVIETFYYKMWVDQNLDTIVDANEWELAFDSDGDGIVDNTTGLGVPVPIPVVEDITDEYDGTYIGNDTFYYQTYILEDGHTVDYDTQSWDDTDGDGFQDEWSVLYEVPDGIADKTDPPEPMVDYLTRNAPWYDQPLTIHPSVEGVENPNEIWNTAYLDPADDGGANSWQAEWVMKAPTDPKIYIDFIDWGNPIENNNPIVGQRFPLEIALYEKLGEVVGGVPTGETMTAYKMACLENPSTRTELFGTSKLDGDGFTQEIYFATVLTNKFTAEVWNPDGSITKLEIEAGIGPSGKMNFASAGGGWIPTMAGSHRIWLHLNDPLIEFEGAKINDDDHLIMSLGLEAEEINHNKAEMSGIVGNSTYIDVLVVKPNGRKK